MHDMPSAACGARAGHAALEAGRTGTPVAACAGTVSACLRACTNRWRALLHASACRATAACVRRRPRTRTHACLQASKRGSIDLIREQDDPELVGGSVAHWPVVTAAVPEAMNDEAHIHAAIATKTGVPLLCLLWDVVYVQLQAKILDDARTWNGRLEHTC